VKVQRMADEAKPEAWPLDEPAGLGQLAEQVLRMVAGHFHPRSSQPLAEMTVPDTLMVIERAARELRLQVSEHVPGSHRITLAQVAGARRLKGHYDRFSPLIKVLQAAVMPQALLRQLLGDLLLGSVFQAGSRNVQRWLLQEYIRKIGYHAIELYGGLVVLEDGRPLEAVTRDSTADLAARRGCGGGGRRAAQDRAARARQRRQVEPGQRAVRRAGRGHRRGAGLDRGQSCLTGWSATRRCARWCTTRPASTPTAPTEVRWIEGEPGRGSRPLGDGRGPAGPGRGAGASRPAAAALADPARRAPPVLVALTHIDRLRPLREWEPPYDLDPPAGPKAEQIVAAVIAAAGDLGVDVSTVIPVCAAPGRVYNVDDALWAAMLFEFPEAHRVRLLRCQRARRSEQDWEHVPGWVESTARRLANGFRQQGYEVAARLLQALYAGRLPVLLRGAALLSGQQSCRAVRDSRRAAWPDEWVDPGTAGMVGPTVEGYNASYRLDPREAIVILGQLPPPARYFGLQTYLLSRPGEWDEDSSQYQFVRDHVPALLNTFFTKLPNNQDRLQLFADLSNSINNVVIENGSSAGLGPGALLRHHAGPDHGRRGPASPRPAWRPDNTSSPSRSLPISARLWRSGSTRGG
jgi:uncharacterized protein